MPIPFLFFRVVGGCTRAKIRTGWGFPQGCEIIAGIIAQNTYFAQFHCSRKALYIANNPINNKIWKFYCIIRTDSRKEDHHIACILYLSMTMCIYKPIVYKAALLYYNTRNYPEINVFCVNSGYKFKHHQTKPDIQRDTIQGIWKYNGNIIGGTRNIK